MPTPQYIFRWKDNLIEVTPSIADTPEQVWEWAKRWLRGASDKDSSYVTKHGEVIPYRKEP